MSALEKSRKYTLQVAEAMPEKNYESKPTEAIWNFKELMQHIAYGMLWMEKNYVLGEQSDWNPPAVAGRKKETVAYINSAFDSLKKVIGKIFPGIEKDKKYVFFQAHNEIPDGKTPVEHFGFVLKSSEL